MRHSDCNQSPDTLWGIFSGSSLSKCLRRHPLIYRNTFTEHLLKLSYPAAVNVRAQLRLPAALLIPVQILLLKTDSRMNIALLSVFIIGSILALSGLGGFAASHKYTLIGKPKAGVSAYVLTFVAFELVVGAFIYGGVQVIAIAQQFCAPPPTQASSTVMRKSGANMTCEKGESNSFVLALQSGRRCVQYIRFDTVDGSHWETAMEECNSRGGYSPHFYNSIDVAKITKWIPVILAAYPRMPGNQGWGGHKATSVEAYKTRNMSEMAWYINPTTTIGINLDLMAQNQISWPVWPPWGGDSVQAYVGMFFVTIAGMEGIPMWFHNDYGQNVYCEYQNPEYVAEFTKYASKRSPAPVFETNINPSVTCDEICSQYPHCMGFNLILITMDKYQCDLVAILMSDLGNATLTDDKYSTYYDLVVV